MYSNVYCQYQHIIKSASINVQLVRLKHCLAVAKWLFIGLKCPRDQDVFLIQYQKIKFKQIYREREESKRRKEKTKLKKRRDESQSSDSEEEKMKRKRRDSNSEPRERSGK
jgi:hypothetical protein